VRVELVRSGGLAGVTIRASLDTDELPPAVATKAEAAIDALDWDAAPTAAGWADGFQYELTVSRGDAQRSKTLQEHELPDDARPLLDALLSRAQLD
jgi:hypothetical protein